MGKDWRTWWVVCWLGVAGAAWGQLNLGPPPFPAGPINDRLVAINQTLTELDRAYRNTKPADRATLAARVQYRQAVRAMLIAGRDAELDGSPLLIDAYTLHDAATAFDQLLSKHNATEIDPILVRFAETVEAGLADWPSENIAESQATAARWFVPLLDLVEPTTPTLPSQIAERVAVLRDGFESGLHLSSEAEDRLTQSVNMVERGLGYATTRAGALALMQQQEQLLAWYTLLETAALPEPVRTGLTDRLNRVALMLDDPAMRDDAIATLAAMAPLQQWLGAPGAEQTMQLLGKPLADRITTRLYDAIFAGEETPRLQAVVQDVYQWAALELAMQQFVRSENLPVEVRRTITTLQGRFAGVSEGIGPQLDLLSQNLERINHPSWTEALAQLDTLAGDVDRLNQVSRWTEMMKPLNAGAARALTTWFRERAEAMMRAEDYLQASRDLAVLEQQLGAFAELPGEAAMQARDPRYLALTGEHHDALLTQLQATRSAWAGAWAFSEQTDAVGLQLDVLRGVFALVDTRVQLGRAEVVWDALEGWSAWHLGESGGRALVMRLESQAMRAIAAVAEQRWDDAAAALGEATDALTIIQRCAQWASGVWTMPGGADQAFAEAVRKVTGSGDGFAHRESEHALATRVCVLVGAYQHDQQPRWLERAADLIERAR